MCVYLCSVCVLVCVCVCVCVWVWVWVWVWVCGWVWVGVGGCVGVGVGVWVGVSMCMSSKCMFSEPLLLGSPVAPLPAQQQGELPSLADLYVQTESLQLSKLN